MQQIQTLDTWLLNSRQRSAVARVLYKPMTATEICERSREYISGMHLQDAWFILQQLQERGIAYCLNPGQAKGHLFFLSEAGRKLVSALTNTQIPPLENEICWKKYSLVARSKTRRVVVATLSKNNRITLSKLRKLLLDFYPIGSNQLFRTLTELAHVGLVEMHWNDENKRVYPLTPLGQAIAAQLRR